MNEKNRGGIFRTYAGLAAGAELLALPLIFFLQIAPSIV